MSVMLLLEHHLEFLNLKYFCTGTSEPTFIKMSYCWKSHVVAHMFVNKFCLESSSTSILCECKQQRPWPKPWLLSDVICTNTTCTCIGFD